MFYWKQFIASMMIMLSFKKYINYILKSLDFNKNVDDNPNLVKTNSDTNSMKHLEEKINELQLENKHLKDESRTLSKIIDLMYNNGSLNNNSNLGSKWEVVKSKINKNESQYCY